MVADFAEQSFFALLFVSFITVVKDIEASVTEVQTQFLSFLQEVDNTTKNIVTKKGIKSFFIIIIYVNPAKIKKMRLSQNS